MNKLIGNELLRRNDNVSKLKGTILCGAHGKEENCNWYYQSHKIKLIQF